MKLEVYQDQKPEPTVQLKLEKSTGEAVSLKTEDGWYLLRIMSDGTFERCVFIHSGAGFQVEGLLQQVVIKD